MQTVHHRLENALRMARSCAEISDRPDVLMHCYRFCAALTSHHTSEDAALFPRLLADHPELEPVVRRLIDDHDVLADLVVQFESALQRSGEGSEEQRQQFQVKLDEIQATMTAHFAYEERELDQALDNLREPVTEAGLFLGQPEAGA